MFNWLDRNVVIPFMMMLSMFRKKLADERGDTNFISIMIILGVVILVAGVFIGFKERIVTEVEGIINDFSVADGAGP